MLVSEMEVRVIQLGTRTLLGRVYPQGDEWFWMEDDGHFGPAIGPFTTIQAAVADLVQHLESNR